MSYSRSADKSTLGELRVYVVDAFGGCSARTIACHNGLVSATYLNSFEHDVLECAPPIPVSLLGCVGTRLKRDEKVCQPEVEVAMYLFLSLLIPSASLLIFIVAAVGITKLQKMGNAKVSGTTRAAVIRKTGVPSTAQIISIEDTGNRIEHVLILVRMTLRVEALPVEASFDANIIMPLSPLDIPRFIKGRIIQVWVDPATREVAVDEHELVPRH